MNDGNVSINGVTKAELSVEDMWYAHIKSCNASGLSKAGYCRKHNLVINRYYYWERKLNSIMPLSAEFLPVKITEDSVTQKVSSLLCCVNFSNGNELKIYDPAVFSVLISILS